MADSADQTATRVAEAVNGFEEMVARQQTIHVWTIASWRNDTLTVHQVNLLDCTCTCQDYQMNCQGTEACDHIIKAAYQAPGHINVGEALNYDLLEQVRELQDAVRTVERRATGLEAEEVRTEISDDAGSTEETTAESSSSSADPVLVEDVQEWLETGFASPDLVDVQAGAHDGQDGTILEPDNQAMSDHVYESFKGLVNSLEDSEVHVGFGDDPCHACGGQDGEFYYFIPEDDSSEVWA